MDWKDVLPIVEKYANVFFKDNKYVPLIMSQIEAESDFDSKAVSSAGAKGLMQLMPATAAELANKLNLTNYNLFEPNINIQLGIKYLSEQYERFKNIDMALAAYNAGPGTVEEHNGIPDYPDTKAYIKKIIDDEHVWRAKIDSINKTLPASNNNYHKDFVSYVLSHYSSFEPDIRPACANFVSKMLRGIRKDFQGDNWVPDWTEKFGFKKVINPQPGDLIIYNNTDRSLLDRTHIGIVLDPSKKEQIDFSASLDKPIIRNWDSTFPCPASIWGFLDPFSDLENSVKKNYNTIIVNIHDGKFSVRNIDSVGNSKDVTKESYITLEIKIPE